MMLKETMSGIEIPVERDAKEMLARHNIELRDSDVSVTHPIHGENTISPSVYAVYLAFIRANYTLEYIRLIVSGDIAGQMGCYQHFASMIHRDDDLPWFTEEQFENPFSLHDQALQDYELCFRLLADSGLYCRLCD